MSEHVCDVKKWNKFTREITKFLTMFYSLIIAHSSCLHMLLPFSLSLYMKIYFLLFLFLTFLLHMALKMFIATFVEFLLPAVDCGICFIFRFLPYWFESRTNLELCMNLKFLSSFRSDFEPVEILRNFYRAKIESTDKPVLKFHTKYKEILWNLETGFFCTTRKLYLSINYMKLPQIRNLQEVYQVSLGRFCLVVHLQMTHMQITTKRSLTLAQKKFEALWWKILHWHFNWRHPKTIREF